MLLQQSLPGGLSQKPKEKPSHSFAPSMRQKRLPPCDFEEKTIKFSIYICLKRLNFAQILFLLISCEVIIFNGQAYMVTFVTITVNIADYTVFVIRRTKIICFGLPKASTIKCPYV